MKRLIVLFLGVWLTYLAFLPPGMYSIDEHSMLAVADSLVANHNVVVPEQLGALGRNGHTYSTWYPLQSILAVPVVALGMATAHAAHAPREAVEAMCALILPALYTAATVPFVYLVAIALGGAESGAWIAALSYAYGTIAMVYARTFFAEPVLALLVASSLYFAFRAEKPQSFLIIAVLNLLIVLAKPTALVVGLVLSLYLLAKKGCRWVSLLPAVGTGLGLAVYCVYNFYRFGNLLQFGPIMTGRLAPSLSYLPQGIIGMLISPGVGIVWYSPCAVLAVIGMWKVRLSRRLEAFAVLTLLLAFLLIHSCWSFWHGGWAWGPRYLLPVLPGLMAFTGVLDGRWRKTLVILAVVSFFLSAPTLVSFYERYLAEANEQGISVSDLLWVPYRSPLVHVWPAAIREVRDAEHNDVVELFGNRTATADTIASSRALRIVAVWWWVLPLVHISRLFGCAFSLALVIIGVSMATLSWRGSGAVRANFR